MKRTIIPGLNVQFPWAKMLVTGAKVIETRTYPIPKKYLNSKIAIIETPGKSASFSARIVGYVIFSHCYKYKSKKHFDSEFDMHLVDQKSEYMWDAALGKWAWVISECHVLKSPKIAPKKRGICWTLKVSL